MRRLSPRLAETASFMEAIQSYQRVEQESRKKHRARMERQIKIVKPEASQAEINAAVNNENGQGDRIFEQAVRSGPLSP